MKEIFDYIASNQTRFQDELAMLVKQPSNSTNREGVEKCASILQGLMVQSGIDTRIMATDGLPVVYGKTPRVQNALTVLIYGHYDVKPPEPLEAWISAPYAPEIREGRMYGRGTADNKGQMYAHVKAVESVLAVKKRLPVNVIFLFDGEEEIASPSLGPFVLHNKSLLKADLMVASDGTLNFDGRPVVQFGVRGVLKIEISCRGGVEDTHSGIYGGLVPNPAWSLIHLLNTMKDENGKVLIEGFYDDVQPPTPSELKAMQHLDFDEKAFCQERGIAAIDKGPGDHPLERLMFWPTFNIQGVFVGTPDAEGINIIPAKARAIIDMRLVPNQMPDKILGLVETQVKRMGHLGNFRVIRKTQMPPFRSPLDHPLSPAVIEAVRSGFGEEPVLIPSMGWTDPTYIFGSSLKIPCFKVPYAQPDSNFHAPNENLRLDVYHKSIQTTAALLYALAERARQ